MYYHLQFKETWEILAKEQSIYDVMIGFVFFLQILYISSVQFWKAGQKKKQTNKKNLPAARV